MDWNLRRSRWRETEFMLREVNLALAPRQSLATVFRDWDDTARKLSESPRKRSRYIYY